MLQDIKMMVKRYMQEKDGTNSTVSSSVVQNDAIPQLSAMNMIVSVCNQKGGCGKTTTAVNLASSLSYKGFKVLLVDLDPQAHAGLGLGVDVESLEKSIYDVLINGCGIESVIHKSSVENMDIVPSNTMLSGAQLELADMLGRETVLRTAFRKLRLLKAYDYIFLDCSPSLNLITINALVASNAVLIPLQTHYYSLEGMKELFCTIDIVRERLNPDITILGILATLFDTRIKVNHVMLEQIRSYFKDMVFKTIIHNNVRLCEAPMHKKPIHIYDPRSRGAKDYALLADEVAAITTKSGALREDADVQEHSIA